jgi:hypothetical protein
MEPAVIAGRAGHESPFAVRGVIEGFYGAYFTFPERRDLIRFLGRHGFTEPAMLAGLVGATDPQLIPLHHNGNPASDGHGELSA